MSLAIDAPATADRPDGPRPGGGFSSRLWLTWRQHRWALVGTLLLAAVLVGWMTYLSTEMTDLWHQCHNMPCPDNSPQDLRLGARPFGLFQQSSYVERLVQYMPLLVGMFLGVPVLSREHEQRTLLLAWSQDVSPARWLWTRLGLLGLFVTAVTAAVAGAIDHLEHVETNVSPGNLFHYEPFLNTGMLPVAISLCWFAVGVALGAALRRTLPAVFGVIAGFVGLLVYLQFRYPTLMKPLSYHRPFKLADDRVWGPNFLAVNGDRVNFGPGQRTNVIDPSGHELDYAELRRVCGTDPDTLFTCLGDNHFTSYVEYQPADRIPEFHLIVGTGYLTLAAVALLTVWLVVRRTNLSAG
ncbi:ABC transporter permease [Dactylosporangium sp. NPDC049525]|uniref:ABC transporter permease n=1 Tax=Dactylosporangium sp. NPDC049525 TaxID=3154730 RepID=UPI00343AD02D